MRQAQQAVQMYLQMNAFQNVIREQLSEVMQIEHRPQHAWERLKNARMSSGRLSE